MDVLTEDDRGPNTDVNKTNFEKSQDTDLSIEAKRRKKNNDEAKVEDGDKGSDEGDCNFLCHRLSFGTSKEQKESDKKSDSVPTIRTFQEEDQEHPMDASIKSLNGCVNSFINRLQIPSESSNFNLVDSPKKDSTIVSQSQRTPVSKPSFLITDILSDNKKERPGTNLLIDPRSLALQHRMFLDRSLTSSSCGSEQGGSGINRFTDNESDDFGDDGSDHEGMKLFTSSVLLFVRCLCLSPILLDRHPAKQSTSCNAEIYLCIIFRTLFCMMHSGNMYLADLQWFVYDFHSFL